MTFNFHRLRRQIWFRAMINAGHNALQPPEDPVEKAPLEDVVAAILGGET